jgi:low affinity Fe/Cu permease
MLLAKFRALPVQLQLDALLYVYQGSALICLVHVMLGKNYDDLAAIDRGIEEWIKHGQLDVLENALEYAEDNKYRFNKEIV